MIIFAIGQFGWSLLSGIISAWLVTIYLPTEEDIAKGAIQYITPGLVIGGFLTVLGLITALSRIFDAVTDPWIASLYAWCKYRTRRNGAEIAADRARGTEDRTGAAWVKRYNTHK